MARQIVERLVLEGSLVLTSPLSLGGAEEGWASDIAVARNGAGRPVIPGTSLAGALRSWFEHEGEREDSPFRSVWGYIGKDGSGAASHLVFHDAVMDSGSIEMRDHVGIDRVEGRAAENIKFDRQSVTQGARFRFKMSADIPAGDGADPVRDSVVHIRDVLAAGLIRLGGATTRGYGTVKLENAALSGISLCSRDGFLAALSGSVSSVGELVPVTPLERPSRLNIRIRWSPVGPIMVKASEEGFEINIVPLTTEVDGKKIPFIPGASIKGAMRSMAERIMATVCDKQPPGTSGGVRFRQMMGEDLAASDALVTALFGAASEDGDGKKKVRRRGKAALTFSDVHSKGADIPTELWRRVMDEEAGELHLGEQGRRDMHVAIDRFTAAPADGKLFSSLALVGMQYTDINIEVSPQRLSVLGEKDQAAAIALLLLVLRELADGQVPIGSGSTRGFGTISVDEVNFSLEGSAGNSALSELATMDWSSFSAFAAGEDVSSRISNIIAGWKDYLDRQRPAA